MVINKAIVCGTVLFRRDNETYLLAFLNQFFWQSWLKPISKLHSAVGKLRASDRDGDYQW